MARIPREAFVPPRLSGIAYVDEDLPIGKRRYLMEPLVLARLLQVAAIGRDDVVLDVGCNTGYGSAVMSQLASTVVALESEPELAKEAERILSELELDNVAVVQGPLEEGYERGGPYNVIVFEGAVSEIPEAICRQLADGGRLVAVLSPDGKVGKIVLFSRIHGQLARTDGYDAFTPMLPGFEPVAKFTF